MYDRKSIIALFVVLGLAACSSESQAPEPEIKIVKTATDNGDNQSWSTGHNMPNPLRVIVTDRGIPVEGVEVTWSVPPGNGFIAPLIAVTGADGISTARWGMSTIAGQYHAYATLDGAEGSPVEFTATAYPNFAHQVRIQSGDGQVQTVGLPLDEPLVLRVGDQFDNPFPGASIEWVVTGGDASVSPTISVSDQAGLASTMVTLGTTAGTVTVLARFPGAATGPRATFAATANP